MFDSMQQIMDRSEETGRLFWEVVLEADMRHRQVTRQQSMAKMLTVWNAMEEASQHYTGQRRSLSGLVGGDGLKMRQYNLKGKNLAGGYVGEVIAEALSMAESNACMCRIVAAPTAGACGVLPAGADAAADFGGTVRGQRHWRGGGPPGIHCRCLRRLSGGDRHGVGHGGRCTGGPA